MCWFADCVTLLSARCKYKDKKYQFYTRMLSFVTAVTFIRPL